jgi:hypothetical protein
MSTRSSRSRSDYRRDPSPSNSGSELGGTSSGRDSSGIPGDSAQHNQFPGSLPIGSGVSGASIETPPKGENVANLFSEELITLGAATKFCPRRRAGRKVHSSTLHRWATRGSGGVFLEVLATPGGLCTSKPAIDRFFMRLTAARNLPGRPSQSCINPGHHEAVEAELARRFKI